MVNDRIDHVIHFDCRLRMIEDSFRQLADLPIQLWKGIIRIKFINLQGLEEAGIDQDGVFKGIEYCASFFYDTACLLNSPAFLETIPPIHKDILRIPENPKTCEKYLYNKLRRHFLQRLVKESLAKFKNR